MDFQDGQARVRRGRRRFLRAVFGTLFLLAGVVFVAALLLARGGSAVLFKDGDPPGWVRILGLALAGLGLIVEVAVLVWAVRTGRYRAGRESPVWAVSWRRRWKLAHQVRRGGVGPDGDLPLLRATARQMANQRWLILLFAGLVTMYLGQALLRFTPVWLVIFSLPTLLFGVSVWQSLRDGRRAEAFLRAHPAEPGTAEGGEATGSGPAAA